MISTFLLLGGAGCLAGALPVPASATGRAFNRFVAGLAAVLIILGLGAAWGGAQGTLARSLWMLAATCAVIASGLSHAGRVAAGRRVLLSAAAWALAGAGVDAAQLASALSQGGLLLTARFVVDALSTAWILGTVLVAMILGHYYLNIAGLDIRHLIRLTVLFLAACLLRASVFAWGMAAEGGALLSPFLGGESLGADLLPAVVLIQRFLFGVAGATALAVMAWRTARINSTQSATGILYIGLIAVLVGELASRYLLFNTGAPL